MEKAAAMGLAVITQGLEAVKAKGIARRATIEEIGIFQVRDGKIVKEQFFY